MPDSRMPYSCDALLHHVRAASYEKLPQETVVRTKMTLADILGCIIGGWKDWGANAIAEYMTDLGGAPQATLWGREVRLPAPQAAFACASSARAFDYGAVESNAPDTFDKPLHGAETTVPAALAAAESRQRSGKELLAALALGEDMAGRLTAALSFAVPLDCRGNVNTLAATVAAANLLHLNEEQCAAALGLAVHQLNGVKQGIHFSIGQGFSARQGILSAELAARGLAGVEDLPAELKKICDALRGTFDPEPLFHELGTRFYSTATFKPYPSCRATHGAIECGLQVLEQGLSVDDIRNIRLHVSPWTKKHLVSRPFRIRRYPHSDAVYSIEYALASVLLRRRCTVDCYTDEAVRDPRIAEIINTMELTSENWPLKEDDIFLSTFLEVFTGDGRCLKAHVRLPLGHEDMGTPVTVEGKQRKFIDNCMAGAGIDAESAMHAWRMVMDMEHLPSLAPLAAALRRKR